MLEIKIHVGHIRQHTSIHHVAFPSWFIDSADIEHMTGKSYVFTSHHANSLIGCVKIMDDSLVPTKGKGQLRLSPSLH